MNIQELEDKHKEIIGESDLVFPAWIFPNEDVDTLYNKEEELVAKVATKLSVEFAIEVLNEVLGNVKGPLINCEYRLHKVRELKQYLDE